MEEKDKMQEPQHLSKEEVFQYEGETIDVGEKKESDSYYQQVEEPEGPFFSNQSRIKVYQGNGSCLIILLVLVVGVIGLFFALPVALFILGLGAVIGLLRKLFS